MAKVYFAKAGELYKIGSSENPDERIKKLQAGSPVKLELVYTFDTPHPRRDEVTLHKMFEAKREHGEWYKLNEADLLKVKQATTPVSDGAHNAPQRPAGAATGALKAINDIWAYRYLLMLFFVVAVPFFLWVETRNDPMSGYLETGRAAPTAQPTPLVGDAQPQPTMLPVGAPIAVQPPPLQGNAQPVQGQQSEEPVASDLIPINDATAQALSGPAPQGEPAAVPAPTPEGWAVTWPAAPNNPTAIAEFAQSAQETLREAGYTFSTKPTIEIPRNYVGN